LFSGFTTCPAQPVNIMATTTVEKTFPMPPPFGLRWPRMRQRQCTFRTTPGRDDAMRSKPLLERA
jgi:hypothetical protein